MVSFLFSPMCDSDTVRSIVDLSSERIFLPWCENEHWRMIIIIPKHFKFQVVDSLGVRSSCVRKTSMFLNFNLRSGDTSWSHEEVSTEKQKDGYNCGVHVLRHFDKVTGHNFLHGTPNESRGQILSYLMENGKVSSEKCSNCTQLKPPSLNRKFGLKWVNCLSCRRKFHPSRSEMNG